MKNNVKKRVIFICRYKNFELNSWIQSLNWKKARKNAVNYSLQKKWSLVNTLTLAQGDLFWTFELQNYEIINLCCFMSASLWPFCYNSNTKLIQVLKEKLPWINSQRRLQSRLLKYGREIKFNPVLSMVS